MAIDGSSSAAATRVDRIFGSAQYFRLWIAQVVSATGDWLGFLAIIITAARVGGGIPEASVGLVVTARILPGFFLAPLAGVLVDRWDRRRTMVVCDLGRAATLAWLPFVDFVWQLVLASLILEGFTLLWAPAKEASVPNLVPREKLIGVNSLSLVAGYGTFPLATGLFWGLAELATELEEIDALSFFRIDQESLSFYVDVLTFLTSAFIISRLTLLKSAPAAQPSQLPDDQVLGFRELALQTFRELREGWSHMFLNPTVRAVNVALATGLIGGGMLVPLGTVFSEDVLNEGTEGFGTFVTALGVGMAIGVLLLSLGQRRIDKRLVFTASVFGAGFCLFVATSMWTLAGSALLVGGVGMCAGGVYVLGFTLLQENVVDEFRGRIFAGLYTLGRLSILIAFAVGPFLALLLNGLSDKFFDKSVSIAGFDVFIPGVRLTLWLAALIIVGAGFLALTSLRREAEDAPLSQALSTDGMTQDFDDQVDPP
ncbi:MAG: MFS transporter [bacterium]|nr:MFS transporter [bacterium]